MRAWFSERIWDFGCWVESRGLAIQDLYWRIRRQSPETEGPLSEIVATTLANRSGELAETMLRNNALLGRLSKKDGQ